MGWSKSLARTGLVGLSRLIGLSTLKGISGTNLYVVNYHSIANEDVDPYINRNTYRTLTEFEEDIVFFKQRFRILSALDVKEYLASGKEVPKDSVVLTFDDGLRINYDFQFPILRKHGVTATFFVCSGFVDNRDLHYGRKSNLLRQAIAERDDPQMNRALKDYLGDHSLLRETVDGSIAGIGYHGKAHLDQLATIAGVDFRSYLSQHKPYLSSQQIQEMIDAGFTIGAHSIDHPRYGELTGDQQFEQTVSSLRFIVETFGLDYRFFAFPHNDDALPAAFFSKIAPHVDLTFGMRGFVDDAVDFHIQRGDIESTGLPIADAFRYRLLLASVHGLRRTRASRRSLAPASLRVS